MAISVSGVRLIAFRIGKTADILPTRRLATDDDGRTRASMTGAIGWSSEPASLRPMTLAELQCYRSTVKEAMVVVLDADGPVWPNQTLGNPGKLCAYGGGI
jgi:hypothetical protein